MKIYFRVSLLRFCLERLIHDSHITTLHLFTHERELKVEVKRWMDLKSLLWSGAVANLH